MRKRMFSLLIAAFLCFSLLPCAALAEGNIIVNLGTVRAGSVLDIQMGTTESGAAELTGGTLPDNCSIITEERNGLSAHYLRGTPGTAGSYEFSIAVADTVTKDVETVVEHPGEEGEEPTTETVVETVTETVTVATLNCSLSVLPAIPSFSVSDLDCFVAEEAFLEVKAEVTDHGTISYQWYSNDVRDNQNGTLLESETGSRLMIDTESPFTGYYYCVITNTNNGLTEVQTTPAITVKVTEPTITSVSIASLPDKLEYTEGDSLDPKGLSLFVRYSNGMTVTDDEGFTLSPTKLDKPGTQTVTVTYQDNTCTFPVVVNEAKEVVEAITLTSLPAKRDYKLGEWLDTQGMVLQVITNKGNRSEVSTGFTCSPQVLDKAGVQTVTVTYQDKTTSFSVTVQAGEKTVQRIEIQTLPAKLSYQVGDSFDPNGMVLKVTTDQGDELIRGGFSCSPARFTREGTQTVTVTYGGQSCTMELVVTPSSEAPAETPKPSVPEKSDPLPEASQQPSTDSREPSGTSRNGFGLLTGVFIFALLIALVAVVAYLYVNRKAEIQTFFAKLFRKDRHSGPEE